MDILNLLRGFESTLDNGGSVWTSRNVELTWRCEIFRLNPVLNTVSHYLKDTTMISNLYLLMNKRFGIFLFPPWNIPPFHLLYYWSLQVSLELDTKSLHRTRLTQSYGRQDRISLGNSTPWLGFIGLPLQLNYCRFLSSLHPRQTQLDRSCQQST